MQRRKFMQQSVMAGAGLIAAANASATKNNTTDNKPFNLNYGIHDGTFKNHAGNNFLDQIQFAYDMGFRAIEDNGMMSRSVEQQQKIGDKLAKLGMSMGVFVITTDSWHWKKSLTTGKKEWIDIIVRDCKTAVEVAKRCNAKYMTVVPGNYEPELPRDYQTANVITALRKGAEILEPHGLVMAQSSHQAGQVRQTRS